MRARVCVCARARVCVRVHACFSNQADDSTVRVLSRKFVCVCVCVRERERERERERDALDQTISNQFEQIKFMSM